MIELKSQIIIAPCLEKILEDIKKMAKEEFLFIFYDEELKIDMVKEAIKEAYLTSEKEKYIVLAAGKFNIYSQNALLKILEEPPANTVFILIAKHKSSLLPTIKSRLPIKVIKDRKKEDEREFFDFENIDLEEIYNFLKVNKKIEKTVAKEIMCFLLKKSVKEKIKLGEKELDFFETASKLVELNTNTKILLLTLLLMILEKKNEDKKNKIG
jgi:DNA polymerase-3 subunit delta'